MPKHRECSTMPRLFTGLEIPAEIGQTLSNLRGGLPGARWIDPENYHVTLRFIGDIDGISANEIARHAGAASRCVQPGRRRLSLGARLFPEQGVHGRALRAVLLARVNRRWPVRGRGFLRSLRIGGAHRTSLDVRRRGMRRLDGAVARQRIPPGSNSRLAICRGLWR